MPHDEDDDRNRPRADVDSLNDQGAAEAGEEEVLRRFVALERAVADLRSEVRTRRMVVVDDRNVERIVAEVADSVAALRIELGPSVGGSASVLAFSTTGRGDLGPMLGIQLWAAGNALVELDMWEDEPGTWRSSLHVADR